MPAQTLRPYQKDGLARLLAAYRDGARSVLLVSPTGSGKTSLFGHLAMQLVGGGKRVLINVHRRELATQACNRLREFDVPFGLIMAGEPRTPYAPVQVASVQTLVRRETPRADLVINDEAHLSTAKTWSTILAAYPHARILGVTATPWRLSGKPLAGLYDACVVVTTPRALCEQGFLCPYVGFSYKTPDLAGVKTTAGEYNEKQSAEAMSSSLIVDNIVEEYGKHARELSGVVFAVTVAHSRQLADRFNAAGIRAEHIDGGTAKFSRDAILARIGRGETQVLCNVGVAVEGLDIPRLKCCVLARPTKSLARAIQMVGRVRRPWNGTTARIHDHAFVVKQHGLPDDDRDYELDAAPEAPPSLRTCPECFAIYSGSKCPACGVETEGEATEREIKTVADGEKIEFSSGIPSPVDEARKLIQDWKDSGGWSQEAARVGELLTGIAALPAPRLAPVKIVWGRTTVGRAFEGTLAERVAEGQGSLGYGKQLFYRVECEKRDYLLPATKQLRDTLGGVDDGSLIRVTHLGEKPAPSGYTQHAFKIEVDDGNP